MISIIIPTYNNDTIKGAIDSILKQKISNLEIIIIDDSEDKKIQQTIQNINHSDIKYYKNTKNLGTTLSRIRGIKIAQGDYIGFLDDDDLMINNNLEKKLKTINEGEIDFVFCDYIINNMMNNKIIEKNLYQYDEDFRKNILYTPGPFLQCCLFRRDFILQHIDGFDPKSEPSEDWNFFIELSKHSPQVKHIKIFGFQWNFSQHSQSSHYEKETNALEYIINNHYDYMINYSTRFLSLQYRKLGSMLYYLKQYDRAKGFFNKAYTTHPWSIKNIIIRLVQFLSNAPYHWLMGQYVKKII